MRKTVVTLDGVDFMINGQKTYSEVPDHKGQGRGLLMNARFIQGIFDDANGRDRYGRFGFESYDPDEQTNRLIEALPEWYAYGLRGFTVGIQGGGPCFTTDNETISNNPYGKDGLSLDPAYANRLDRLITGADDLGMVVIVSLLYGAQTARLQDGRAVRNAIKTAANFLRDQGYTNVIIEVANEYNVPQFKEHDLIYRSEGIAAMIDYAREASGGMLVGSSPMGNFVDQEVCQVSDVVFLHGNGCSRQALYKIIQEAKKYAPDKPIVINEDSQAIGNMAVAVREGVSWGYYNNITKQEPPTYWQVTPGEDLFFAERMAGLVLGKESLLPGSQHYYLQGLEAHMTDQGKRWLRVAALYPELVDYVTFYRNGQVFDRCYDEPFSVHFESNWQQKPVVEQEGDHWQAEVVLRDGRQIHL